MLKSIVEGKEKSFRIKIYVKLGGPSRSDRALAMDPETD